VGQKEKRKKRSRLFECLLLVKPLSFWSQNTRKEATKKNKIFSEKKQNSLVLAAKIYIISKYLVRDLIFVISLVHRVRV